MEDNKNPISDKGASILDNATDFISNFIVRTKGNKYYFYHEVMCKFTRILKSDNSVNKIKNNDKLNDMVYEIYYLIKDNFIDKD